MILCASFISLSSCQTNPKTAFRVYQPKDYVYYQSAFNFDRPYIEDELFLFPLFSDTKNLDISHVQFEYQSGIVPLSNLEIETVDHSNTEFGGEDQKFYKYLVNLKISVLELDTLSVDKIEFIINGKTVPFNVDIEFTYDSNPLYNLKKSNYNYMFSRYTDMFENQITMEYRFQWIGAHLELQSVRHVLDYPMTKVKVGYLLEDNTTETKDYQKGIVLDGLIKVIQITFNLEDYSSVFFNELVIIELTIDHNETVYVPLTRNISLPSFPELLYSEPGLSLQSSDFIDY